MIAVACSILGGITSIAVASTICYLAMMLPANRWIQLGGVFGGILFAGVVGIIFHLSDGRISDAAIVSMLGVGVASGMYVSMRLCRLLS